MNYITLKQYKKNIIASFVFFALAWVFFLLYFQNIIIWLSFLAFTLLCMTIPIRHIIRYKKLSGICEQYSRQVGKVEDYKQRKRKGMAAIVVNVNGETFLTEYYFLPDEAKRFVGDIVTCAYIEDELFIYEIKN